VAGFLLGPSPEIQVIRIYKYKNISLFLQVNLSITEFGKVRKMVYSRTDSSSFGRHYTQPGSIAHVRESSQGSGVILPLVQEIMVAPMPEELAIVKASNPGSAIGKWYDRVAPDADDIPEGETKSIRKQLVHKAVNEFVKNIVPHKIEVDIEIDSKGNEDAIKLIKEGNYTEAIKTIKNVDSLLEPDMYNLALLLEATANIKDNYEEALSYYIQLNDKIQDDRYIEGIGRIEKVIRNMKRIKNI
jgi:tetratricopeptide (TPR) repeat protein